jgi:hypothetical protein
MDTVGLFSRNHVGKMVTFRINLIRNLEDISGTKLATYLAPFAPFRNDIYSAPRYRHAIDIERCTRVDLHASLRFSVISPIGDKRAHSCRPLPQFPVSIPGKDTRSSQVSMWPQVSRGPPQSHSGIRHDRLPYKRALPEVGI